MELGLSQQQTLKQIQTLSPQMYMSMEILCLNALDLEQRVAEELENNETLERVEPTSEETTDRESEGRDESAEGDGYDESFDARFERWEQYSQEEYASPRSSRTSHGDGDEKYEALSNTEGRPESLQEHLEGQVSLMSDQEIAELHRRLLEGSLPSIEVSSGLREAQPAYQRAVESGRLGPVLTPKQLELVRGLAAEIIYNLDNRGYLLYSLADIFENLTQKDGKEEDDVRDSAIDAHVLAEEDRWALGLALAIVQSLEPPGVGGRTLQECLLLQLRRDPQDYPLEEKIIAQHLDDLGHNRLPKIARALGVTIEDVKLAGETIASLDPLPGKLYGSELPRYVKPDVVVDEIDGRYEVRVDSDYLPRIQISDHYRSLYQQSKKDPAIKKYLKKKIDNAEWLLTAIRQRQSTLLRIAQAIVEVQSGFLDHGISHLKPLKMADLAEKLGVHVSTISRAISGKYIQTPRGIFEMKFFFTGGATKDDGNVEARGSVIQRIKDLIANEDKTNPLSDISIVRKLAESGIKISRRTVTKYREAEAIPSSRERRSY
ncbi:MAG TPA: RNA polymerase factor sigma-54 [Planctomycetota bacterium]|nr:RNA polymerase factor sigma-54 [Planctomycetota bacterium]